jgi:alpha-mannosidase
MEAYMLNLPVLSVHPIANAKAECEAIPSMLSIDCRNVIVETIKKTEDGKGVIVRAYENENRRTKVNIMFGREFKKVTECDLLENECGPVAKEARAFSFEINPYEIKTFRIIY